MQPGKFYVGSHDKTRVDAIVRISRRNSERTVGGGQREYPLFWRLFRENDPESRLVAHCVTMRRVVNLENNVRAGFDEFGLSGTKNFRRLAWRIADKKITGQRAGVRLLLCFDLRRGKKNSGLLSAEPLGIWFANKRNDVMDHRAIGGTNFRGLDPLVFAEAGGNNHVL